MPVVEGACDGAEDGPGARKRWVRSSRGAENARAPVPRSETCSDMSHVCASKKTRCARTNGCREVEETNSRLDDLAQPRRPSFAAMGPGSCSTGPTESTPSARTGQAW